MDSTAMELISAEKPWILLCYFGRCAFFGLSPLNNKLAFSLFLVIFEHALKIVKRSAVFHFHFRLYGGVPFLDVIDERTLINEFIEPEFTLLVVFLPLFQIPEVLMSILLEDIDSLVRFVSFQLAKELHIYFWHPNLVRMWSHEHQNEFDVKKGLLVLGIIFLWKLRR